MKEIWGQINLGNDGRNIDVVNLGFWSIFTNPNYLLTEPSFVEEPLDWHSEHQTFRDIAEEKMRTWAPGWLVSWMSRLLISVQSSCQGCGVTPVSACVGLCSRFHDGLGACLGFSLSLSLPIPPTCVLALLKKKSENKDNFVTWD